LADNVDITQGAGTAIAADEIGGVKHQRVKISLGADGAATDLVPAIAGVTQQSVGLGAVVPHVLGSDDAYRPMATPVKLLDSDSGFFTLTNTPMLFNGTYYDRQRGNTEGTLLASAARTASVSSPIMENHNARGVALVLNVTVASGTGGLTVYIVARETATVTTFVLNATPTAVTAVSKSIYMLYPGIAAGVGEVTQATSSVLPRGWYALVNHADGSSYTYSLAYSLIV
jgi:hypothetical protein